MLTSHLAQTYTIPLPYESSMVSGQSSVTKIRTFYSVTIHSFIIITCGLHGEDSWDLSYGQGPMNSL